MQETRRNVQPRVKTNSKAIPAVIFYRRHRHSWVLKEQWLYLKVMAWRERAIRPAVIGLTRLGLSANMMSFLHVALMLAFALAVAAFPTIALILLLLSLASDALDGQLARYQNTASRMGKLVDRGADAASLALYAWALMRGGLASPVLCVAWVTTAVIALAIRIRRNSVCIKNDDKAGEASLCSGMAFAAFPVIQLFAINVVSGVLGISIGGLAIEMVFNLWVISRNPRASAA